MTGKITGQHGSETRNQHQRRRKQSRPDANKSSSHRIDGLRMIAGTTRRELEWPGTGRFPPYGAVWTRRALDRHLIEATSRS